MRQLELVQATDLELDALAEQKGQTPPELIDAAQLRTHLESRLTLKLKELEERNASIRAVELEMGSLTELRRGAANSALRADNAKEAAQFQNHELQFATRLQELEEDVLPLMESQERLQAEVAELRTQIEEVDPVLADLQETENVRLAELEALIDTRTQERDSLAAGIGAPLLKTYEQIRRARRGVGIVVVGEGSRCSGCNVVLPIHVIQKVRRGGGIVKCPSCGRILYSGS